MIDVFFWILEIILSFGTSLMIVTGEIVLTILTFGYHRPRFNKDTHKEYTSEFPFRNLNFWVGIMFWVCVGAYMRFYLSGD